jgi:hypothetical protein
MKTYDRFLSTLADEFRLQAQPRLRSLWADVMELEEATHEPAFSAAREQTMHRVLALGRAARAVHAHEVRALSQALARLVTTVACTPDATRTETFATLYQKMTEMTEALYGLHTHAVTGGDDGVPAEEMELAGCGAN